MMAGDVSPVAMFFFCNLPLVEVVAPFHLVNDGVGYCVWQLFSLAHPGLAAQAASIMGGRSTL